MFGGVWGVLGVFGEKGLICVRNDDNLGASGLYDDKLHGAAIA